MSRKKASGSNVKKRNWAFVLYPESAPEDWKDQLQKTGLQCVISPLHDRDVNPTGEPKKAHYHVILCYSGPTACSVVRRITDSLNQPVPQPLEQVKGYYRYLTHRDNPEKAQYSKSDIECLNGFEIRDFMELTKGEIIKLTREIMDFIRESDITEYAVLMEILEDSGEKMAEHFEVARSNTLFFKAYLTSRWRLKTGQGIEMDKN